MSDRIHRAVDEYYTRKIHRFGAVPRGVDWNDASSQALRFEKLAGLFESRTRFSVTDFGCGYGALYRHLDGKRKRFDYRGIDVSSAMVAAAKKRWADRSNCRFVTGAAHNLRRTDFTVASGAFNVKLRFGTGEWEKYVLSVLRQFNRVSRRGFGFNLLTRYSDPAKRRDDLYYADPCFYFDFCKKQFSKKVALLHDYPLYEFTVIVRKD